MKIKLLFLLFLLLGTIRPDGGLCAQDAPRIRLFADMSETFDVPEGIGELTEVEARGSGHYRFEYDGADRVVRVESRAPSGRIVPDFFHVRVLTFEYGEDGSLLRRVWRSPENAVDLVWRYEGKDRIRFENIFLGEYPPLELLPFRDGLFQNLSECESDLMECGSLAGLALVRDGQGRVVRADFLRADGSPGTDSMGTAGHLYERDEKGRFTRTVLLNEEGKPHADFFGVTEYRIRYGEDDRLAEIGCFGPDGKPVNNNRGFAFLRQVFPEPGLCRISFAGADGSPATDKMERCASMTTRYGLNGRTDTVLFYGTDGLPCEGRLGAARMDFFYPEADVEEIRLSTLSGLPPGSGFSRLRIFRNEHGRVIRTDFLEEDSEEPVRSALNTLTDRGLVKEQVIEAEGRTVKRIRTQRRADGALTTRTVLSPDGQVLEEKHFEFDALGTTRKWYQAGQGGYRNEPRDGEKPAKVILVDGNGKDTGEYLIFSRDPSGSRKEESFLVPPKPDGIARIVHTLDARGNRIREEFFQADGTPLKKDAAVILREFDARGNETLVRGLTASGAPALLPGESYAERRRTFDDRDNVTAAMWLDCDLMPVFQHGAVPHPALMWFPAAIVRMKFDPADQLIRADLFPEDETGFPEFGGAASLRIERKRLPRGGEDIFWQFHDDSGALCHPFGGAASGCRLLFRDGTIRYSFLDKNLKVTLAPDLGYAEKFVDLQSDSARYFDADGNELEPPEDEEDEEDGEDEGE